MVGAPRRLGARGPGDRVAHPASLLHTMRMVPGTFKNLGAIVPVQQAAAAMESFFQQLVFNVQNLWSGQPRHETIQYDNHGFRLTITAMGDTIPWEFVQHTAFNGLELAARGFTELFDIMYANADGNILVAVSLRLLEHTLPSGSGESSQTGGADPGRDWREGSVPSVGTGADAANNVNNNNMLGTMGWGGGGTR
ncbi:hypothetical protein XPA_002985 [Xanthoria parietina]